MYTFPDEPVTRNYKTKERAAIEYIKMNFPDITWICDKRISDGCSKRRPDIYADFGHFIMSGEVDESKHESYVPSCEKRRTEQLFQDFGCRPMVTIRFNPDSYIRHGETIRSCWTTDGNGILRVSKKNEKEWAHRLTTLHATIQYWIDHPIEKTDGPHIVYLFYDD
jgi:hypothetical protein